MNPDTALGQTLNCGPHVHCIAAEPIELRHDQHIAFFHPVK
ncbi:transposon resolvase domain protein [Burkholderia pseudomallei MSHR7343]|nr:transposon resolvase domain protein [Burkholderia pseudomallei MSHR7343]